MNRIQKLLLGVVALTAVAGPALAAPELPPCKAGSRPVTLVIRTDTTSGWTVNGAPVSAVGNGAWVNVAPASWIGPGGAATPQSLVYKITFNTPMMHGPMTVQARWAADNCGASIKAGTANAVSVNGCSNTVTGKDFQSVHTTNVVSFGPGDSASPTSTITFTVANQAGTATGFAGVFTITAQCICRG